MLIKLHSLNDRSALAASSPDDTERPNAPTCPHCNVLMRWYYSKLERQNDSDFIVHSFYCDTCSAVVTVREPMKPHYEFLVA